MSINTPTRIYKDIDMSFELNPVTADIGRKYDVNAVKQSIKNLLMTPYYTKPFAPRYGSPIYGMLFEPMDASTGDILATLIQEAIDNYEKRVRVDRITVVPDYSDNLYRVQLDFHVIGVRDPQTFTTSLRRLR